MYLATYCIVPKTFLDNDSFPVPVWSPMSDMALETGS